jgi:ADP-heptose:LPS heptosyltransferase
MKVVINRSDALGDLILTTPMAECIKNHFPKAHITFIISPRVGKLIKNHPFIDDTWTLDSSIDLKKKFKEYRPSHYFFVGGSHRPCFYAWQCKVPFRGGIKSRLASFLFLNQGIRQKRSRSEMHEVNYNLELLRTLLPNITNSYPPILQITQEASNQALKKATLDEDDEYIVIHPGMTGHTLNWPMKSFANLLKQLDKDFAGRFKLLVSFTPSDGPYILELKEHLKKSPLKLVYLNGANLGITGFMGILKKAALYIGPSTGPTHIANALGTKLIGLYSPIRVQNSTRWGPYNLAKHRGAIFTPQVDCKERIKCAGSNCREFPCMKTIQVEQLMTKIKELL